VIRAWRGLGYNRRALALRAAAKAIVEEHDGRVPDTLDALLRLPGIGPYTARAVLAIAFGRPVAALDVNIRRVLGRAFLRPDAAPRALQAAADDLVPRGDAARWTHALMDIGAAYCRPRDPRCDACPLRATCRYAAGAPPSGAAAPRPRARHVRFEETTRWLRGRILDRLRDAPDWVTFAAPIGTHGADAVAASLAQLAREGMIQLEPPRARLVA
jgi:A/G-specific adenine glycosylase